MATTRRNHLTTSQDRSPFILERRRKLFPIEDYDIDSELGHISPLCSDTASDSDNEEVNSISDYDIIDTVENTKVLGNETPVSNKTYSETMSPLKLSPYSNMFVKEPKKYSPSQNLKTPHDTSTKPVLQKEQKTLLEESKSLKRKSSPSSSPEQSKSLKIDYKSSKVRTALFPPENDVYTPLAAKSFYSKNQDHIPSHIPEKLCSNRDKYTTKYVKFSTGRHSSKYRKKFGQINNGVGHKIRKPKQRKISKSVISKAAKKLLESGSVLNDYLQDLKELRDKQNTENKLIINPITFKDNLTIAKSVKTPTPNEDLNCMKGLTSTKNLESYPAKQIQTFIEENKENIQTKDNIQNEFLQRSVNPLSPTSPKDTKPRKFFKSSRAKVDSNLEKKKNQQFSSNISSLNQNCKKYDLHQSPEIISKVFLEPINDFEDEDVEPATNIDNILSVLSDDNIHKNKHELQNFEKSCEAPFQSNINVLNLLNNVVSKNIEDNDSDGVGETLQTNFDANIQEAADISRNQLQNGFQSFLVDPKSNCDVLMATGYQNVDSLQHLQSNKNENIGNDIYTNNKLINDAHVVNNYKETVAANRLTNFSEGFDGNLSTDGAHNSSSTLEPCIVSSQVIFDNILLEDVHPTIVSALSNQTGLYSTGSNDILGTNQLETNETYNCSNRITLEAHNSILASENSIQLHQSNVANMILSPISQMCDVTSGLALNSPKRGRKLSPLLNNMSRASKILSFTTSHSVDMEQQQQKLFPVFYPGAKGAPNRGEKREKGEVKRSAKKFKALHEDQMLLDAGQKKFGYTVCEECKIVYHMGDPGDEIEHMNYHNASHILRFGGWKNEHVMADFQKNGRIIRILPSDSKIWLKKVKELMEFVKRDFGCYEIEYDISGSQVYLYIKNRTIAGCAVAAVPKEAGHRMLSSVSGVAMCSEESFPIKCGISHIWVAANFRKQGIGTALMNAVKNNFFYGSILKDTDIALTSPTEAGSAFAEKYFKTPNYLIYYT